MIATLCKNERLSGKKDISTLMDDGKWGHSLHIRYCCRAGNGLDHSRIMVSVPKKNFKRAVRRNLLKRRMRESYRVQKDLLPAGFDVLFFYSSPEICDYDTIRTEIAFILGRIAADSKPE